MTDTTTGRATLASGADVYREAFVEGIRPTPPISVREWADTYRQLSPIASREHGQWKTARTPYLAEIMDALSPECPAWEITFAKGAQVGGTEVGNNFLGWIVHQNPGPVLFVWPTIDLAKRGSHGRVDPMFRDTPALTDRVRKPKSRDSGNTVLWKEFRGGALALVGANSGSGLRSLPARYVIEDEIDAFPLDVDGEGDPCALAERGTRTFKQGLKIFKISTPKLRDTSRIWKSFLASDRRRYHVPCPFCGELQVLVWEGFEWEGNDPKTVHYRCEKCAEPIPESAKGRMLAEGVWVPEFPEVSDVRRGYHLPSFYSPPGWRGWSDIVAGYLRSMGRLGSDSEGLVTPELVKVWTNQDLGEPYAEPGTAPEWEVLYRRRESYERWTVPAEASLVTAGVDVQDDRLEVEVVAWGDRFRSWSVDYVTLVGAPTADSTWKKLAELLGRPIPVVGGKKGATTTIRRAAIDASFETMAVRAWVRRQSAERVIPVRGKVDLPSHLGQPRAMEIKRDGRKLRGALEWPVGVDILKAELYGWLRQDPPLDKEGELPRGWCSFPEYGEEYFRMLTAEARVAVRSSRGYIVHRWEKIRPRNEALDCRIYARAALATLGADRWAPEDWQRLRETLASGTSAEPTKRERRRGGSKATERWRGRRE